MNASCDPLVDWAIRKIKKEYKDDICLLIGHQTLKLEKDMEDTALSFFIPDPDSEKALNLARTFMINGIGHDLFPMSWERVEGLAGLTEYNTSCLGDGQILYYRNESDKNRFLALQAKLQENLHNRVFMFNKALEKVDMAMEIFQTMIFEESLGKVRKAAGYIADFLSIAVAAVNLTYFKNGQTYQIRDLAAMQDLPEDFIALYNAIVETQTKERLKELCYKMIRTTRHFLGVRKTGTKERSHPDFADLASWYQELCYTWRRVYHWCDQKDPVKSFIWGCSLQYELDIVVEEFGLDSIDFLGAYSADDLPVYRKMAEAAENKILSIIAEHGVKLDAYASIEEFLAKNA
ncbi:MAG: hypothetical protein VB070_05640 [Clostridiaceae bacterium]|nr:hypothetical protein [Clostridiaceae bacterium]